MKLGRNDPCYCGSGKKYKKCCWEKDIKNLATAISKSADNLKNEARIKRCLHPNQHECDGKIIKAHAIQNNRILNKIAENGMVITTDGVSNLLFQGTDKKGRGIATTFTGFCKHHDKILFQEIEDKDFVCSEKQIFLLSYRTMAWHFHKKQEQVNANEIFTRKMQQQGFLPPKTKDRRDYIKGLSLAIKDNNIEKQQFDKALLSENYNAINCSIWEIPYEINFAVSTMIAIEHDILGNRINDLTKETNIKTIYLNIFPGNGKSFCVWSWLKTNDKVYTNFAKQFLSLSETDRKNYLNNKLPRWSDSIIISPKLWDKWGQGIQEAFVSHANFDVLYRELEKAENLYAYTYMDTPWCLFEQLEK